MFESILSSVKLQTAKLSENLDNIKSQTSKISEAWFSTVKRGNVYNRKAVGTDSSRNVHQRKRDLKWPVLVDNKMHWVSLGSRQMDDNEDEEDIVDKFIRVINVDDDTSKRRNDREEIRRRLAMGSDTDDYYGGERASKKPSLQARLQSVSLSPIGMNLQICFMNETVSDIESPGSDTETPAAPGPDKMSVPRSNTLPTKCVQPTPTTRPSTSLLSLPLRVDSEPSQPLSEADFFARQARLQAEARMALAQAKEMAHMQMEVERQRQKKSPITEMVRCSLEKVGIPFPEDRRRVSRQILTEMNVAQLQVIVNDLHTQIEILNEGLVKFLMDRDDLHMEQDSMLVDIEDLTRYLGAKEQSVKEQKDIHLLNQNNNLLSSKPKINRIASIGKK